MGKLHDWSWSFLVPCLQAYPALKLPSSLPFLFLWLTCIHPSSFSSKVTSKNGVPFPALCWTASPLVTWQPHCEHIARAGNRPVCSWILAAPRWASHSAALANDRSQDPLSIGFLLGWANGRHRWEREGQGVSLPLSAWSSTTGKGCNSSQPPAPAGQPLSPQSSSCPVAPSSRLR